MKLSIGKAWDETRAILSRDGGPLITVALALMVLPGTVLETLSPSSSRGEDTPGWVALVGLLAALISLTGQLAISRIALGRTTTVGEAIALAFRRLPVLFGSLLLISLPFAIVVGVPVIAASGGGVPTQLPRSYALPLLVAMLLFVFVLVRMLFLTPLAADRTAGPIALIKESWRLSRGRALRLFGLFVLLLIVGLIVLGGLGGAVSAVILLLLGAAEPGSLSALLIALVQQVLSAAVSLIFIIIVCRLYLQAMAASSNASVPDAGHH